MKLEWYYEGDQVITIKEFLNQKDLPRAFLKDVKRTGKILLNKMPVAIRFTISRGDHLQLITAPEPGHSNMVPSFVSIDIVYEDDHLLIVNKPVGVVSIPSRKDPDTAMANRVRGYYLKQNYRNQVVHIVTRLDRDTSGLMIIAKHRLAHALLDRQLRAKTLERYYYALTSKSDWAAHGILDGPIARSEDSIITRRVHSTGKRALTEYWMLEQFNAGALLRLQLHTGRTHQLRVHLTHEGGPLIGDTLYGGPVSPWIVRQSLHCAELKLDHPFTKESLHLKQPIPQDMINWIQHQENVMIN